MESNYQKQKSQNNITFPRIFVVGCPRSGTTLLQSLISAHSLIFSFPESHFFPNILSENRINRIFGIASKNAGKSTVAFFKTFAKQGLMESIPEKSRRVMSYTGSFENILDMIAFKKGKKLWLEKTPQHLHYIKPIERYIKNAKFIHVVRNGEDVVASLYEVTRRYPEIWGGPRTIDECLKRWIEDVKITIKYISKLNHIAVKYEELVDNPQKIIRQICDFIGVEFQGAMLEKYRTAVSKVLLKGENWKLEVNRSIENNNGKKFSNVFNHEEREYVRKLLGNSTSLALYQKLRCGKLVTE